MKDVRWKQLFFNFDKAFSRLKEALEMGYLNELERNGLVQRFEFTLELSWKVLKDFLQEKGFEYKPTPKDTFREAQRAGFIDYAQELVDGLDLRNELSHDYDGQKFEAAEKHLRDVTFPCIERLHGFFSEILKTENPEA
jgi:nucleotidyltransferase substrate binding protein (TIGR01987 family)